MVQSEAAREALLPFNRRLGVGVVVLAGVLVLAWIQPFAARPVVPGPVEEVVETVKAVESADRVAVVDDVSACQPLEKVEPAAMMGRLTPDEETCLDDWIESTDPPAGADLPSRLLMANAWAKGDKRTWERSVYRHITQIDDADPDILYKYALYLSQKGVGRAEEVIYWSEAALLGQERWSGENKRSRVYSLHKLRAAAAQDLWKAAEGARRPGPKRQAQAVDRAREHTLLAALAWSRVRVAFARDDDVPYRLCVSAGGDPAVCQDPPAESVADAWLLTDRLGLQGARRKGG